MEVKSDHHLPPKVVGGIFHQVVFYICVRRKRKVNVPFKSQNGLQSDSAVRRLSCLFEE